MVSIGWAIIIAIVSGSLGMLCMAMCAAGAYADDQQELEFLRWQSKHDSTKHDATTETD